MLLARPPAAYPLVVLCLLAAACAKEGIEDFDGNAEAKPPGVLLAVVDIPKATDTAPLADFLGTVAPEARSAAYGIPLGVSTLITEHIVSADAIDLESPMRMLVVDPDLADPPLAFIATAKGPIEAEGGGAARALEGDLVLFGSKAAVSELLPHAAHLASTPVTEWQATVYPKHLLSRYRSELRNMSSKLGSSAEVPTMKEMMRFYGEALEAFAEGTETVTVHLDGRGPESHLVIEARAVERSKVAEFFAAQEVWERETLELLPAMESPTMVGLGTIHAGPTLDALREYMELFLAGSEGGKARSDVFDKFFELWTGEMAVVMDMQMRPEVGSFDMQMVSVAPVGAGAADVLNQLFQSFVGTREVLGMTQTLEYEPRSRQYRGVDLARYHAVTEMADTSAISNPAATFASQEQISEVAVTDGKVIVGTAGESNYVERAIDRLHGDGEAFTPSPALRTAIDTSLAAGESFLFYMDVAGAMPGQPVPLPEMVLSAGFTARSMTVRFRFLR